MNAVQSFRDLGMGNMQKTCSCILALILLGIMVRATSHQTSKLLPLGIVSWIPAKARLRTSKFGTEPLRHEYDRERYAIRRRVVCGHNRIPPSGSRSVVGHVPTRHGLACTSTVSLMRVVPAESASATAAASPATVYSTDPTEDPPSRPL